MTEISFKTLTLKDIVAMRKYFQDCAYRISDYSATFKYMWQRHDALEFAYVENCVVFRERYQGRIYFHYPLELCEGDAERALDAIECFARENSERLHYTCVPREKMTDMLDRYGSDMRATNKRRWRDYLYNASDFITYGGKKYAGQRNHVNKFKKLYGYRFVNLCGDDAGRIYDFLKRFEQRQLAKGTVTAREEMNSVYELVPHLDYLGALVGAIEVDGEIIALSIGERCGDTLIIAIEKALTDYEGAYPLMAQEFAAHFATDGVKYINREDDSGDAGLRKSKLQYNPVALVDKYDVYPRRAIDRLTHLPVINSERLTIKEVGDSDALEFYRLEYDAERNKYWGYNWREHISSAPTPEYFMQEMREDFSRRDEIPLGIYVGRQLVGEVVLHNFGYRNDCEAGVRLLPEYEGNGYAKESLLAVLGYAFYELNVDTVLAKCYKANVKSRAALLSAGFRASGEDETYYHFRKTAAM